MNFTLLKVAIRNVARNKRRSAVTLAAIGFGVTVVIVLSGLKNGYINMSIENVVNSKVGAIQIHLKGYLENVAVNPTSYHFPYNDELKNKISAVPGVKAVTGRIGFAGIVSNGRNQAQFFGVGIDPISEITVCPKGAANIEPGGAPFDATDKAVTLVGAELGHSLGAALRKGDAQLEDNLTDSLNLSTSSPEGRQNAIDVKVKGLVKSNLPIEEKRVLTVPLVLAQELLGLTGEVTEMAIAIDSLENIDNIKANLVRQLDSKFEVHDWQEILPFFRDVLFRQKFLMGLISLVLLILVLFIIVNTMLMSVFERVREIGTMLSVGVKQGQILQIFVLEALTLGIIGAAIGVVFGSALIYWFGIKGISFESAMGFQSSTLYTVTSIEFVIVTFLIAATCSCVAGLFPAWKASRLNPVDALRSN